jgi:hypothetical protein
VILIFAFGRLRDEKAGSGCIWRIQQHLWLLCLMAPGWLIDCDWVRLYLWMFVSCVYMLSCVGRGLCNGLITRPEESYRVSNSAWLRNLKVRTQGPIWAVEPLDGWMETMSQNCGHQWAYCSSHRRHVSVEGHGIVPGTVRSRICSRCVEWNVCRHKGPTSSNNLVARPWRPWPYYSGVCVFSVLFVVDSFPPFKSL